MCKDVDVTTKLLTKWKEIVLKEFIAATNDEWIVCECKWFVLSCLTQEPKLVGGFLTSQVQDWVILFILYLMKHIYIDSLLSNTYLCNIEQRQITTNTLMTLCAISKTFLTTWIIYKILVTYFYIRLMKCSYNNNEKTISIIIISLVIIFT